MIRRSFLKATDAIFKYAALFLVYPFKKLDPTKYNADFINSQWKCEAFALDDYNRHLVFHFTCDTHPPYTVRVTQYQTEKSIQVACSGGIIFLDTWLEFIRDFQDQLAWKPYTGEDL